MVIFLKGEFMKTYETVRLNNGKSSNEYVVALCIISRAIVSLCAVCPQ